MIKNRLATDEEKKIYETSIGKIVWLTNIIRPDGSFIYLSTVQSKPQMSDLLRVKKLLRVLKNHNAYILINTLDLRNIRIAVFSDASFGNLNGGASQIGYIILLYDKFNRAVPIM